MYVITEVTTSFTVNGPEIPPLRLARCARKFKKPPTNQNLRQTEACDELANFDLTRIGVYTTTVGGRGGGDLVK